MTILSAVRTAHGGADRDLGEVLLTEGSAGEDASQGRGLLITDCCEERLVSHLCDAIQNSLPLRSAVVPLSHIVVQEIVTILESRHKLSVWRTVHESEEEIGRVAAPVWLTVPEKLAVLDRYVRSGVRPSNIIHVVDLALPATAIHCLSICGRSRWHLLNIGRHKAACQANGVTPYMIVWTPERCQEVPHRYLCQALGVDAWLYANGRTLRTAAFKRVNHHLDRVGGY